MSMTVAETTDFNAGVLTGMAVLNEALETGIVAAVAKYADIIQNMLIIEVLACGGDPEAAGAGGP
jgi:hypothetical protein